VGWYRAWQRHLSSATAAGISEQLRLSDSPVPRGAGAVLVGENGAGKTRLALQLAELHPAEATGEISFAAHARFVRECGERHVIRVLQDDGGGASDGASDGVVRQLLVSLGLYDCYAKKVEHLSTGEVRKVLLARALARSPRLLLLNKPYDGLDAESRERLRWALGQASKGFSPLLVDVGVAQSTLDPVGLVLVAHRFSELPPELGSVVLLDTPAAHGQGPLGAAGALLAPRVGGVGELAAAAVAAVGDDGRIVAQELAHRVFEQEDDWSLPQHEQEEFVTVGVLGDSLEEEGEIFRREKDDAVLRRWIREQREAPAAAQASAPPSGELELPRRWRAASGSGTAKNAVPAALEMRGATLAVPLEETEAARRLAAEAQPTSQAGVCGFPGAKKQREEQVSFRLALLRCVVCSILC